MQQTTEYVQTTAHRDRFLRQVRRHRFEPMRTQRTHLPMPAPQSRLGFLQSYQPSPFNSHPPFVSGRILPMYQNAIAPVAAPLLANTDNKLRIRVNVTVGSTDYQFEYAADNPLELIRSARQHLMRYPSEVREQVLLTIDEALSSENLSPLPSRASSSSASPCVSASSSQADQEQANKMQSKVESWLTDSASNLNEEPYDLMPWTQTDPVERHSTPLYSSRLLQRRPTHRRPSTDPSGRLLPRDPRSLPAVMRRVDVTVRDDRGFPIRNSELRGDPQGAAMVEFGPSFAVEMDFMGQPSAASTRVYPQGIRLNVSLERTAARLEPLRFVFEGRTTGDLRQRVLEQAMRLPQEQADNLLVEALQAIMQIESQS